jgi:hypothetical protein
VLSNSTQSNKGSRRDPKSGFCLAWQKQTGANRTFLVHGEENCMTKFAAHLGDTQVEMPMPNQSFEL